jgi:membrane-associated phospholipid phosphatase
MQQLLKFDIELLRLINQKGSNAFFDGLMPWLRTSEMWAPLYLFLIVFVVVNFKKTGWWWVLFAICTVTLSDVTSSRLIKENILRLRPCNDPALSNWLHVLVGYRPQSSSFTSSHATNHFALAAFIYFTFKLHFKKWPCVFFLWAGSICYAQVYVGVHYPLDVAAGTVIGILIGYLCATGFNKLYSLK